MPVGDNDNHGESKDSKKAPAESSLPCDTTTQAGDGGVVVDNPCWGSKSQHSLSYLLTQLDRATSVLFESQDYLALNKPPDLRMDGAYPATVHKLLTVWYPPPSFLQAYHDHQSNAETANNNDQAPQSPLPPPTPQQLAQFLSETNRYHLHSDHPDNALRPCHQLDYATSGVLWVARSRAAANHARTALEERRVQKAYLAVVQGELSVSRVCPETRVPSREHVQTVFQTMEESHRRKQRKRRPDTFQGFLPAHNIFQIWQQRKPHSPTSGATGTEGNESKKVKRNTHRTNPKSAAIPPPTLTPEDWKRVWEKVPLSSGSGNDNGDDNREFMVEPSMKWKEVKQLGQQHYFEEAAKVHNDTLRSYHENHEQLQGELEEQQGVSSTRLPLVFQIDQNEKEGKHKNEDKDESFTTKQHDNNTLFICASIADIPGQFPVVLHPEETKSLLPPTSHLLLSHSDTPPIDTTTRTAKRHTTEKTPCVAALYRPALTECTILSYDATHDTTKVLLRPWSGRRHQLRIHMALLGCSIVGDFTYRESTTTTRRDSLRMCLHAHRLRVPLPPSNGGGNARGKRFKPSSKEEQEEDAKEQVMEFVAPDPFR